MWLAFQARSRVMPIRLLYGARSENPHSENPSPRNECRMTAVYNRALLPSGFLRVAEGASSSRTASSVRESVLIRITDVFYSNAVLGGHLSELKSSFPYLQMESTSSVMLLR